MNIVEFVENYFKLDQESIELYDYQKGILRDDSNYRIVNKSRQVGISTTIAIESLVYALSKNDITILLVSVAERQSKELLGKVKMFYKDISPKIKIPSESETKTEMIFRNGSRIISLPNNPKTVRGYTADRIYLDEFANFEKEDAIWEAVMPSITRGGKITICSTPLGKLGKFYEIWDGEEDFSKHKIPWKRCPDIKDRIEIIKKGMPDKMQFRQEYCCEFVDETMSFFPYDLIRDNVNEDLEMGGAETMYLGLDFGKRMDSTVVMGVESTENGAKLRLMKEFGEETETYKEPKDYIIRNIKNHNWNVIRINADEGGPGDEIVEDLKTKLGSIINGVQFSAPNKEKLIWNLKHLLLDNKLELPDDEKLIKQLHALRKKVTNSGNVQYQHPSSGKVQHDDYVWALALACMNLKKRRTSTNARRFKGSLLKRAKKKRSFK